MGRVLLWGLPARPGPARGCPLPGPGRRDRRRQTRDSSRALQLSSSLTRAALRVPFLVSGGLMLKVARPGNLVLASSC